jgi:hypothetical protein
MQSHTKDCLEYGNPHRQHNPRTCKYCIEVLQCEHPRPPVNPAQHGVIAVIESVDEHIPDRIQRQEADTEHNQIIDDIENRFAFGFTFKSKHI